MRDATAALLVIAGLASGLGWAAEPPSPGAPAPPAAQAAVPAKAAPPAAKTGSVSGRVTGPDGKPLAGATVRAMGATPDTGKWRGARPDLPKIVTAITGADGTFKIDGLTGDSYAIRVEAKGAAPAYAEKVPPGASLALKLKAGLTVSGHVVDLTTQKPFAGASVRALEHDAAAFGRDASHAATSGEDGGFSIPDCAPGVVSLDAVAPGRAHARLDNVVVRAPAPDETPKANVNTLFLRPGGRLAGRVVGGDGKPVVDAVVSAAGTDGAIFSMMREAPPSQRTDAAGRFDFDGIPAGNRWTIRARKPGLADGETPAQAVEAGTDRGDLEIKLESGAAVTVRLQNADDVAVTEVDVTLRPSAAGGGAAAPRPRSFLSMGGAAVGSEQIAAGAEGKLTIKNLEAGAFDITFSPADYGDVVKEGVRLRAGETVDLGTLRVKESKNIAGRVTDSGGQPVPGATVATFWFDGSAAHSREAKSKPDGRYKLSGLGDQPVRDMWVSADGFATSRKEGAVPGDNAVDFTLDRLGSVAGKVLMPDGSAPPAFRVIAHPEAKAGQERAGFRMVVGMGGGDADKTFVDPAGNFRLDNVAPGKVTLEVRADGVAPGRKTGLDVQANQVADAGTISLQNGRTLSGRVLAAKDDAPVPGATVTVSPPQGFTMRMGTDAVDGFAVSALDGTFEIDGLESRAYAVATSQPDYSPASGRVEIPPDQDVTDFVARLSKGGILTGLVRDAGKQPIPSVQVLVTKMPAGGGPQTATTGADGRYTFEKLPPGDYIVMRAPSPGQPLMIMSGMKQASVTEGITTEFNLDDASKITLSGRVLRGGQPIPNATVMLNPGGLGEGAAVDLKTARADDTGHYQVGLDKPGTYAAMVSAAGTMSFGSASVTIEVPDQPAPVVDIVLKASGISGHVTGADGKPVANAYVTAAATGAHETPRASSDPDGAYKIESIEAGTYKLTATAPGFRNGEIPAVKVTADAETPGIDFRLDSARTLRGHVVDPGGRGIGGAMVVAAGTGTLPAGRDSMPTTTDVNGSFVITAPVDGPLDLTAIAPGYAPARATGVTPTDDQDVTLQAPRGGRIRLVVTGPDGKPVAGASIACTATPAFLGSSTAGFMNHPTATDATGTSIAGSLAAGAYECTARLGARTAGKPATVDEGGEAVVAIVLP